MKNYCLLSIEMRCFLRTSQKIRATTVKRKNQIADANDSVAHLNAPNEAPKQAINIHENSSTFNINYSFTVILPVTLNIL